MFIRYNPESEIEHLRAEFEEGKAKIWADRTMPLEEKDPEIYRLWREFDRQRKELQSAAQGGATGEEGSAFPRSPRRPFLPRRRLPSWK
jgi:hypothetical protein